MDDLEDKPKSLPALHKMSERERYSYIMDISSKVLEKCGLVSAAIIGKKVEETGDGVVDYARVFLSSCFISIRVYECSRSWRWTP